jgi:pimeloyl-ACP methyl ester carboxylesterase
VSGPIQERVAVFGEARGLVGILTIPMSEPEQKAPHFLLLTTGILHRVGTGRLWVHLARALGGVGFTSLRFDYSGIGDSERRRDVGSLRDSVDRDIVEAIDYLRTTRGAERIVLIGLCSGANDAIITAAKNPRVVGAVLIDMLGPFRTWRVDAHNFVSRVRQVSTWKNPLRKFISFSRTLVPRGTAVADADGTYVLAGRSPVARERMRDQLGQILERQCRLFVTFTGGLPLHYNHQSQFRRLFPSAARHQALSYAYYPEIDHSFSRRVFRTRLVDDVVRWATREAFAAADGPGTDGPGAGASSPALASGDAKP